MQVLKDLKRHPLQKMLAAREIILEILEILEILRLLQTIGSAGDRPPRYGEKAGHRGGQAPAPRENAVFVTQHE